MTPTSSAEASIGSEHSEMGMSSLGPPRQVLDKDIPKYGHPCAIQLLWLLPMAALLAGWRISIEYLCGGDSLDCDWSIGLAVIAMVLGCAACVGAAVLNCPEHRFYLSEGG